MLVTTRKRSFILPLVTLAFLVSIVLIATTGPFEYQLRFKHPASNYWLAAILAIVLPISIGWLAISLHSRILCAAGLVVAWVIAIPAVTFAFLAIAAAPNSSSMVDSSFELISETFVQGVAYRLYRTNCGATCAFGLEVQREIDTPFGFKFATPLWSKYRESKGEIRATAQNIQVLQDSRVIWEKKLYP